MSFLTGFYPFFRHSNLICWKSEKYDNSESYLYDGLHFLYLHEKYHPQNLIIDVIKLNL